VPTTLRPALLALTTATALTIAVPSPAPAAEPAVTGYVSGEVNVQENSFEPPTCTAFNNTDQDDALIDGAPDHSSVSIGGGIPGAGENASSDMSVTSTYSSGWLTDVAFTSSLYVHAHDDAGGNDPDTPDFEGSHCSHFARAKANGGADFTLSTKRKIKLTVAGDLGTLILSGDTLADVVYADNNEDYDDILNNVVVALGPGEYHLDATPYTVEARAGWGESIDVGTDQVADSSVTFKAHLWRPGLASGPVTGSGKSYVSFPVSRLCATNALKIGFKNAAKIKKVTLSAAGKSKSVSLPGAKTKLTLSGLRHDKAITALASVRLKSGALVKAKRSYDPC